MGAVVIVAAQTVVTQRMMTDILTNILKIAKPEVPIITPAIGRLCLGPYPFPTTKGGETGLPR